MAKGGRAWRGWFPLGGELTSGVARRQGGPLLRRRAGRRPPRVLAGLPLHGPNLFPAEPGGAARRRARLPRRHDRARAPAGAPVARRSGSTPGWFDRHLTADPTVLFRIFRYPPPPSRRRRGGAWPSTPTTACSRSWPRTSSGGLEVRGPDGWIDAPPVPGSFVVQPRRHARADDRRRLPVDPPPGAQRRRRRTPVVPPFLRPGVGRRGRTGSRWSASRPTATTPRSAGTAPARTTGRAPTATTCWARSPRSSPTCRRRRLDPRVKLPLTRRRDDDRQGRPQGQVRRGAGQAPAARRQRPVPAAEGPAGPLPRRPVHARSSSGTRRPTT